VGGVWLILLRSVVCLVVLRCVYVRFGVCIVLCSGVWYGLVRECLHPSLGLDTSGWCIAYTVAWWECCVYWCWLWRFVALCVRVYNGKSVVVW
jgi:hypothetical protein